MAHFLPTPYPDELFYSVQCRYHVRSGNASAKHSTEDIYGHFKQKISAELANELQSVRNASKMHLISEIDILLAHTLLPYYTRFFGGERKREVIAELISGKGGNSVHKVGIYQSCAEQPPFFRYCPQCFMEDLDKYGEPYWHRLHQLADLRVCLTHGCWLAKTSLPKYNHQRIYLPATADMTLQPVMETPPSRQELEFSLLCAKALTNPFDMEDGRRYITAFDVALKERGWRTITGKRTQNQLLGEKMRGFFGPYLPDDDFTTERISSTFSANKHPAPRYILQAAFFLGLNTETLFTAKNQPDAGEEIRNRHAAGESQRSIARELGIDPATVRRWCRDVPITVKRITSPKRSSPKRNWEEADAKYLPLVESLLAGAENEKPQKITLTWVAKQLGGVSANQLQKMSRCAELIAQYTEPIEDTWQRRLLWAEDSLLAEGLPTNETAVFKKAGILKKRYIKRKDESDVDTNRCFPR